MPQALPHSVVDWQIAVVIVVVCRHIRHPMIQTCCTEYILALLVCCGKCLVCEDIETFSMLKCALLVLPVLVSGSCPFMAGQQQRIGSSQPAGYHDINSEEDKAYRRALSEVSFEAVQADITALLHDSQEWWPADYGNYGPFFIRLSWHCAGSYRTSDGRGGCDGGRQRFDPEQSWEDNTNLDKARQLLWPIKEKYGMGLSWGDLITLAGTTAIEDMGGPVLGFCGGRRDDEDGAASAALGPTTVQAVVAPCDEQGNCTSPLGTTNVGLIYVNPEGPMGVPDPAGAASQVRDTFSRMGMNDTETVALIGGGHAFGKTHGACPLGAGPNPHQDPENPWPGLCGTGKGNDTYTSGFEGPWTTQPTVWDNEFFHNLLNYNWQKYIGPAGHWQWNATNHDGSPGPAISMLTTDISLIYDPDYLALVQHYADDMSDFENQFSHAWYKLISRDMGPYTRCMGDEVPPPQPFQYPLPPPPSTLPDFTAVADDIMSVIYSPKNEVLEMDSTGSYGPLFVRLAWQCASTFRGTDYQGGCNGARIRFPPQSEWYANAALTQALDLLQPVKDKYGDDLTWADLIVLSGNVALEDAASRAGVGLSIPFRGGRADATSADPPLPSYLESTLTGGQNTDSITAMKDAMSVMSLTAREYVVLIGGGHSLGQMHYNRSGFVNGTWTSDPTKLDNEWFLNVLNHDYVEIGDDNEHLEYVTDLGDGKMLYMLKTDMNLRFDAVYRALVQEYASNATLFYSDFVSAWVKIMNIDMFDSTAGETGDATRSDNDNEDDDDALGVGSPGFYGVIAAGVVVLVSSVLVAYHVGTRVGSGEESKDLL